MLTPDTPSPSEWDHFLNRQVDAHLLQTAAWGEVKARFGWQVARVGLRDEWGDLVAGGAASAETAAAARRDDGVSADGTLCR